MDLDSASYDASIKFAEDLYCVMSDVLSIACPNIGRSENCSERSSREEGKTSYGQCIHFPMRYAVF